MTAVESPAATLRRAAEKIRKLAEAATPGPWTAHRYDWPDDFEASIGKYSETDVVGHGHEGGGVVEWADAEWIAAMHPGVGLALAAVLEQTAEVLADRPVPHDLPLLAVARALLGGES